MGQGSSGRGRGVGRGRGSGRGRGAGPTTQPRERGQVRNRENSQEEDNSPERRGSVLSHGDATESINSVTATESDAVNVEPDNSNSGDYQAEDQQLVQPNSIFSIPRNTMVKQPGGLLGEQDS